MAYQGRARRHEVLVGVDALFTPGQAVGILGGPGSGKSTLMQIMVGAMQPNSGRVRRTSRTSFLVGTGALVNSNFTMREIVTFTARLYGANTRRVLDFVADFAELGPSMNHKIEAHARDAKSRLIYTLSYAMPFDIYLADENLVSGPPKFREKCAGLIHERRKTAGLVFATRNVRNVATFADTGAVLHKGGLTFYPTVDEAIAAYEALNPRWQNSSRNVMEDSDDEEEEDTMTGFL